jgi:hypothetical protein
LKTLSIVMYVPNKNTVTFTIKEDSLYQISRSSSVLYSGRKIAASFGNVTVRGEIRWNGQGASKTAKSLSEHV